MVTYAAVNMLLDHLETYLTEKMVTEVLDETAVTELRPGKLQDDPTKQSGLNIMIIAPEETLPIVLSTKKGKDGMTTPTYLVGGGVFFIIPFKLRFILHFKGEQDRNNARTKAQIIFARAKQALLTIDMPVNPNTGTPEDDFHEAPLMCTVRTGYINEGGGPGHFIWRGYMDFQFISEQLSSEYLLDD